MKPKLIKSALRLAEAGIPELHAVGDTEQEAIFMKGVAIGALMSSEVGSSPSDLLSSIRLAQDVSTVIKSRRESGEYIPLGLLSGLSEEEVLIAQSYFKTLDSEIRNKFLDRKTTENNHLTINDLINLKQILEEQDDPN